MELYNSFVFVCMVIVRYIQKEIVFKNVGYTPKQVYVNVLFLEDFVDVWTSTTQLSSKPSDCPSLVMQRLFDECSCMNHTLSSLQSVPRDSQG